MSLLHLLLIEADNSHSLGGSCIRDLSTLYNYAKKFSVDKKISIGQSIILSIDNDTKIQAKFPNSTFDKLSNYKSVFSSFTSKIKSTDYVIVLISGHGYQQRSNTKEEIDMLDEYISYNGGIILDNEINSLLVSKLTISKRTICLADTCHSGTIFDNTINNKNVYSISACLDNQLDSCDIGNNTGFGGALTVHLLDQPNSINTLLLGTNDDIKQLIKKIENIMKPLRQVPNLIIPLN
jgi:hypothetical protein